MLDKFYILKPHWKNGNGNGSVEKCFSKYSRFWRCLLMTWISEEAIWIKFQREFVNKFN